MTLNTIFGVVLTNSNNDNNNNVGQSDMNLSPLALPCSRISLVQGGVYCLACGGWALGLFVK